MAKWKRGNIGRFWEPESYRTLDFVKKLAPDIDGKVWEENQYGSVYDGSNTMPEWVRYLDTKFELKNQTYSFYKIDSGEVMPVHVDHFRTYQRLFDVNYRNIRRVLIMLENWKPGHYLEIDGVGIVNWVAGDWFMWESDVPHSAANIGTTPRYTLQITGETFLDSFTAWARLYSFNIPGRVTEKENVRNIVGLMTNRIPRNIKEGPFYIYGHNQRIVGLDKIEHDEETISYLNEKGIHFYLYEPLCLYSVWKPLRQMGFYAEYKNNHKDEYLRADELDSILDYAQKNKLTNITVHTCDYGADRVYGPRYSGLKIICDDIFLRLQPNFPSLVKPSNEAANFTKRFISLNWRYTVHRHIIASYLSTMKDDVNLTWYYRADIGTIFNPNMWTDSVVWGNKVPKQYEKFVEGITALNQHSPFVLDCNIKESTFIPETFPIIGYPDEHNKTTHPLDPKSELRTGSIEDFYNDSFVDIVTESRFAQPTANYSEKAYQPMYYRKPFVLVAPPYTLKYLKEQGFKTFSDFWDESYDEEENHQERIIKVLNVVDYISSKSMNELQEMYAGMQDILNHNKKLFEEKVKPMKKVAMIGLGKLGMPCAEVMSEHYDVTGYDITPVETPSEVKVCSALKEALKDRDIIFVAVPTPHDPEYGGETPTSHLPAKDFDYTEVKKLLSNINKHVDKHQLIVLISTVLPGTVRKELRGCISKAKFIYNPYLIAMGTVKWDMTNPEMVIIGTEDGDPTGDAQELIKFYRPFMENNPRYEVGTYDEAEAIKIFYNTFISAKLALVNMIQDVAEANGNMNVDIVTTALAKSTQRITGPAYMKAGMGDGGSCHPRDNIALRSLSENLELGYDLFGTITQTREVQAERMAKKCLEFGKTVCIVGKAFKPGVAYTYGSPSMLVGHYIEQHGGTVLYYDPNVSNDPFPKDAEVYLIGYIEDWVFKLDFPEAAVVIDPWRTLTDRGARTIHYGNTRIQ
jgi:UDPglucose 6-dehydrogenase